MSVRVTSTDHTALREVVIDQLQAAHALKAGSLKMFDPMHEAFGSHRDGLGRLGGQNHGANARDAFVFEHVEIATLELLERPDDEADQTEEAE